MGRRLDHSRGRLYHFDFGHEQLQGPGDHCLSLDLPHFWRFCVRTGCGQSQLGRRWQGFHP